MEWRGGTEAMSEMSVFIHDLCSCACFTMFTFERGLGASCLRYRDFVMLPRHEDSFCFAGEAARSTIAIRTALGGGAAFCCRLLR